MFTTILWATDGSESAATALPAAAELAKTLRARLVVAHAREIFVGRGGGFPVIADEDELQKHIEEQVADLRATGVSTTYVVRTCTSGHAAKTIAEIARENGVDLIVVGTHGYGRMAGLLLGSVTQGLLHEGVCPVLAIPTGHVTESEPATLETTAAQ